MKLTWINPDRVKLKPAANMKTKLRENQAVKNNIQWTGGRASFCDAQQRPAVISHYRGGVRRPPVK